MMRGAVRLFLLGSALALPGAEKYRLARPASYSGMADASGAVAVDSKYFVAADDEDNVLRVFDREKGGPPVKELDCTPFIYFRGKSVEGDLEAGARLGDRAFWIGSHGRNKNGRERPNRGCFFATDIRVAAGAMQLLPVGVPCHDLLNQLERAPALQKLRLAEAAARGPKERGGLSIEGLAATPESHLLIGFRNPIPKGKAVLVPLLNPEEVIFGQKARFGDPIQLDLGGLGIRDIAFFAGIYLIIGGSYESGGKSELFRWRGPGFAPERLKVKHFGQYNPEAIIIYPDKGLTEVQFLSDDGTAPVNGVPGKEVRDPARKKFRSFWVEKLP